MSEFEHCPKFSCFLIMTPPLTEKLRDILQERESAILNYLRLSCAISGYLGLSWAISYYLKLSRAILDFLVLSLTIYVNYQVSRYK